MWSQCFNTHKFQSPISPLLRTSFAHHWLWTFNIYIGLIAWQKNSHVQQTTVGLPCHSSCLFLCWPLWSRNLCSCPDWTWTASLWPILPQTKHIPFLCCCLLYNATESTFASSFFLLLLYYLVINLSLRDSRVNVHFLDASKHISDIIS